MTEGGVEVALVFPMEAHRFTGVFSHAHFRPHWAVGATVLSGYADQVIQLKRYRRKILIGALQHIGQKAAAHAQDFQLKEDCRPCFEQVGFAAAIGASTDEGRKAVGLGQFILQAPFRAEVMLKTTGQAAADQFRATRSPAW